LNFFTGNYWDKYEGYDLDRNGTGDIAYRPVSMYSMIVERNPASMILLRSFMSTLMDKAEKVIPSLTPEQLKDELPAMRSFPLKTYL
jgi:nitrous oxidase accessory protein